MSWFCKVVTAMSWDSALWLRILAISAATFGILGTWNRTSSAIVDSNMFLASSCGWFAVASYYVHEGYKSKAASFDQEEESRFLLKESISEEVTITEDKETREAICRASKILAVLKDKEHAGPIVEPQLRRTSFTLAALTRLSTLSQRTILGLIMDREGSSSLGREAKKEPSSESSLMK
jgi:hypothetical protein